MIYDFRKEEMDYLGELYTINADNTTYILVLSSIPNVKGNKLRWITYLTDKKGNILCDASVAFGLEGFHKITEDLLRLLANKAKKKTGLDFSDTFVDIMAQSMGTEN